MQPLALPTLGFEIGALYSRQRDIHGRFGGQERRGIVTPEQHPYIFAFTGEVGKQHGYFDGWDDDNRFRYYGEGQLGDMKDAGGNLAIRTHVQTGKRLFLFRALGKSQPYRFIGEFVVESTYAETDVPDRAGNPRRAIVFRLRPVDVVISGESESAAHIADNYPLGPASKTATVQVRTKQWLFRQRIADVEKACRLTGVRDLRFLTASHIKPWSSCSDDAEKLDRNNGLLLTPSADRLFDRGWISFRETGELLVAKDLPPAVSSRIGLDLRAGRDCGRFREPQRAFLQFHREVLFEKRYRNIKDPLADLEGS